MIHATPAVRNIWAALPAENRARTLASARFVDLANNKDDKDWRRRSCLQIIGGQSLPEPHLAAWKTFAPATLQLQLVSRLIVNGNAAALENGGLCLDRTSGLPFIPGSANKGAARRRAIADIAAAADATAKVALAIPFCRVFGWTEELWKEGRESQESGAAFISDLAWACGEHFLEVRQQVAMQLLGDASDSPWEKLGNFAGAICFLPAFPDKDPGIEQDVITCHYSKYYNGKEPHALDTDGPNPVLIPVVKAGPLFTFPLIPTPRAKEGDLAKASEWLRRAVIGFGIGAKTAAGYGRFAVPGQTIGAEKMDLFPPPALAPVDAFRARWPQGFVARTLVAFTDDLLAVAALDMGAANEIFETTVRPSVVARRVRLTDINTQDFVNPTKNPNGTKLLTTLGVTF